MDAVIVTVVIIGALLAIASGVWVAIALLKAISSHQATTTAGFQKDKINHTLQENHKIHTHESSN